MTLVISLNVPFCPPPFASTPLQLCPVCLRQLLWNLQVEAVLYLRRLEDFCRRNRIAEAGWSAKAVAALEVEMHSSFAFLTMLAASSLYWPTVMDWEGRARSSRRC